MRSLLDAHLVILLREKRLPTQDATVPKGTRPRSYSYQAETTWEASNEVPSMEAATVAAAYAGWRMEESHRKRTSRRICWTWVIYLGRCV